MEFHFLLAAVAVVASACATSPEVTPGGAPRLDIGVDFTDLNEAAKAGCRWIWDHHPEAAHKWEYCGALYRDGKAIRVTLPMTEYRNGQCGSPRGPPDEPPGTVLLGKYHNHKFETEPSFYDLKIAKEHPSLGLFLCSPSGMVRRIDAKEGTVIVK